MHIRSRFVTIDDMLETPAVETVTLTAMSDRIGSLDTLRGVATLGILVMNAVSFGLVDAAYANLSQDGNRTPLDWLIGMVGRVFVDEKMMAVFSLLFGVGIVVFAERAAVKGRRPVWLSLWRNVLLLAVGIVHSLIWDGDILTVYAVCAPFVLLLRKLPTTALLVLGVALATVPAVWGIFMSGLSPSDVGEVWLADGTSISDAVSFLLLLNVFGRALGLMLIGVAMYRLGVVQGRVGADVLRRIAVWGLIVGLPLSVAGLTVHVATDWSSSGSLVGFSISTLGTVPLALAYVALIVQWGVRPTPRLQAVGRMALTNYLTQTLLGIAVLGTLLADVDLTRTMIAAFIATVWVLQLAWSSWWLDRFRFGPFEWAWRCCTYRSMQTLRR